MNKPSRPAEPKPLFHIPRTRTEWAAEGREWVKSIAIVLVVFLPLVTFVVQGFRIPSSSMEDTLLIGDFLFADKITFGARVPLTHDARLPGVRSPKVGDIVIFKSPQSGENLIKRCVAVAGQTVEVRDKILYVDGARRDDTFTKHIDRYVRAGRDNFGPITVPAGDIFCMGDNRDMSHDSRFFGPVPLRLVIAKADVLYFSFDVKKFLPRLNRIGKML